MLDWDVSPGNHSNSEVAAGNATVFFVFEGWRAILAYLLNMCLCEYFYFKSEINKISTFWNVIRALCVLLTLREVCILIS